MYFLIIFNKQKVITSIDINKPTNWSTNISLKATLINHILTQNCKYQQK